MIDILIKIYVGVNLFFTGYYLADSYKWQKTKSEKITCILWCIGIIFFGCAYIIISLMYIFVWATLNYFQAPFWATFYTTKKWNNLEKQQLERINRIATEIRNKNSIKDKIFRCCVALINKRNNY